MTAYRSGYGSLFDIDGIFAGDTGLLFDPVRFWLCGSKPTEPLTLRTWADGT